MTYAQLQQDIADFLNRQDLTASIPVFIRLTESRMNRNIRTRDMEYRVTAQIDRQFSTLPTDFLEMRNIQVNTNPVTALQYVTPQEADRIRSSNLQGGQQFFSIVGNRLELIPVPVETIVVEMVYYSKIPSLSDVSPSNWLLERHYDLYLYGALVQAALYLKDDPTAWATLFDSALAEIEVEDVRSQFHGTTPQMRGTTIG
jgi:hypothetical protein